MRLLALATVAVLGTGCYSNPCDRAVTIDWSFTDLNGNAGLRCIDVGPAGGLNPGVQFVDIFVDGQPVVHTNSPNCTDYSATIFGLSGGEHTITVEGYDSANAIIDRDQFSVPGTCGDTVLPANLREGDLLLDYHFTPVDACGAPPTYMFYQVTDLVSGLPISSITSASPPLTRTSAACDVTNQFSFPVPAGQYRLDWIGEVDSSFLPLYQDCTASFATVPGAGTTPIRADLTAISGTTPHICVQ